MMKENGMNMPTEEDGDDAMREHCKMMPQMAGCEKNAAAPGAEEVVHPDQVRLCPWR